MSSRADATYPRRAMPDRLIRLGAQLAVALCTLFVAASASAQGDPDAQIRALVDGAYDDYDNLRLDDAAGRLRQATDIATRSSVASPAAAEAWLMLGVVENATTGDSGTVLNHFVQALLIDPNAALHPYYATPTLQELLDQAREFAPAPSQPAQQQPPVQQPPVQQPPVQQPPVQQPPASQPIITHAPALEAQAGVPVLLTATVPITVPVSRVVINYRRVGDPQFVGVDMVAQPDGVTFIGEIPGSATRSSVQVEYYITVQDRAGQVLGTAGNPQQPIRTVVFGAASGDVDLGRGNDRGRDRDRSRDGGSDEVFHFGLGGGTGFGLATAEPNVYFDTVQINPGFAVTPLHLGFELGWVPARSLHLVPFLRMQLVILETGIEPLALGGLKVRYFVRDEGPFRVHVGGGLGYGEVSHLVYLAEEDAYDTTNEGPFHIGAGLGLLYMFNDTVGLHNEFYTMVMFDRVSLQIDWTLGLYFAF